MKRRPVLYDYDLRKVEDTLCASFGPSAGETLMYYHVYSGTRDTEHAPRGFISDRLQAISVFISRSRIADRATLFQDVTVIAKSIRFPGYIVRGYRK